MSIPGYIDDDNDDDVDNDNDDIGDDVDDVLVGERVCTHRLSDAASWGEKTHTLCIYWIGKHHRHRHNHYQHHHHQQEYEDENHNQREDIHHAVHYNQ